MNKHKKIVYLVRHAKSSWKDSSLTDRERPLNKRGRRGAPDMGQRMLRQDHAPDFIISSPANRAFSTAKLIAKQLDFDREKIMTNENLYFSGSDGMLKVLAGVDDQFRKVMMVGHNPVMTNLMNILSDSYSANMPTCAIAVIGLDITSWSEVYLADGTLLAYDYPKGPGSFNT